MTVVMIIQAEEHRQRRRRLLPSGEWMVFTMAKVGVEMVSFLRDWAHWPAGAPSSPALPCLPCPGLIAVLAYFPLELFVSD